MKLKTQAEQVLEQIHSGEFDPKQFLVPRLGACEPCAWTYEFADGSVIHTSLDAPGFAWYAIPSPDDFEKIYPFR